MKRTKRILRVFPVLGLSFASLLILGLGRGHQPGTVVLMGTVLDPGSAQPLPGAEVSWRSQRVTTDRTGHYEIRLPGGIREISVSMAHRPPVKKLLIISEAGSSFTQDVLLPDSTRMLHRVLALNRDLRVEPHQKILSSDVPASTISLTDEYGNQDVSLALNTGNHSVHSPVWINATALAFAKDGFIHSSANASHLGVFEYQTGSARIRQIAAHIGVQFLSKAPRKNTLAVATSREVFVMDSISSDASPHRIFKLDPNRGFILSVAWASDDRIYVTIDDSVPLDDRHYLTRSRIASIRADGTDFDSDWAAESDHSFRYPMSVNNGEILFCRFALDGKQQTLWSRNLATGKTMPLVEPALRAVYLDTAESRLYYIYRDNLHLRDLRSGADWIIVNSVKEADYLR
jgi:hypothetical protein